MKDYTDEDDNPVRVQPDDLVCTPDNATVKLKCRVGQNVQRQFNARVHYRCAK